MPQGSKGSPDSCSSAGAQPREGKAALGCGGGILYPDFCVKNQIPVPWLYAGFFLLGKEGSAQRGFFLLGEEGSAQRGFFLLRVCWELQEQLFGVGLLCAVIEHF